jgi:hypothetical protein
MFLGSGLREEEIGTLLSWNGLQVSQVKTIAFEILKHHR